MTQAVAQTDLDGLTLVQRGKVRDVYSVTLDRDYPGAARGTEALLIVATDRLSAYDVVLDPPIPSKGAVLTRLSVWWFDQVKDLVDNHLITADVSEMPAAVQAHAEILRDRTMLVHKLEMFPVECVARGYLTGSGWKDYLRSGAVCGHELPEGLPESVRLDPILFTPATKAEQGDHDENISVARAAEIVGQDTAKELEELTLTLYGRARDLAAERGILLADTKLEFGRDASGTIRLADEIFTPDSSRFWDADRYEAGRGQDSYDKQRVRNWLDEAGWDRSPPAPTLPAEVVNDTTTTYRAIFERLTGSALS